LSLRRHGAFTAEHASTYCPQRQRVARGGEAPVCIQCGACVDACPSAARQMIGREIDVAQLMEEVLLDRQFFDQSGGGVTVSGGEPLTQVAFTSALLLTCRRRGLHTAVDTCGYAPRDVILAVAPLVDLFLYDVKTIDTELHKNVTGVPNDLILANLQALCSAHTNIWLRVPLVPGVNLSSGQLRATAELAASLPSVRQVNLLPYHRWGSAKAPSRGDGDQPGYGLVSEEKLGEITQIFHDAGITPVIGG